MGSGEKRRQDLDYPTTIPCKKLPCSGTPLRTDGMYLLSWMHWSKQELPSNQIKVGIFEEILFIPIAARDTSVCWLSLFKYEIEQHESNICYQRTKRRNYEVSILTGMGRNCSWEGIVDERQEINSVENLTPCSRDSSSDLLSFFSTQPGRKIEHNISQETALHVAYVCVWNPFPEMFVCCLVKFFEEAKEGTRTYVFGRSYKILGHSSPWVAMFTISSKVPKSSVP